MSTSDVELDCIVLQRVEPHTTAGLCASIHIHTHTHTAICLVVAKCMFKHISVLFVREYMDLIYQLLIATGS